MAGVPELYTSVDVEAVGDHDGVTSGPEPVVTRTSVKGLKSWTVQMLKLPAELEENATLVESGA
jgi:hypothetical protein